MDKEFIRLDTEKCIRCGGCVDECPIRVLEMGPRGPRVRIRPCIACGHCVAVCPTGAIDNVNAPHAGPEAIEPAELPERSKAAYLLRARRSCRSYLAKPIPRETIREVLDVARFAPTAGNTQGVHFHVVDDRARLEEIVGASMQWAGKLPQLAPHLAAMIVHHRTTGEDNVLWGAPCLILALMNEAAAPLFRQNGRFMLTYAGIYAPVVGLGSCWAGWVESAAMAGDARMAELLQLPPGEAVAGALAIGWPRHRFERIPSRRPLNLTWAE